MKPAGPCPSGHHLFDKEGNGCLRELAGVVLLASEGWGRKQDVGEASYTRDGIVQHDGDATAEAQGHQSVLAGPDSIAGDFHQRFAIVVHADRRKMRSRTLTVSMRVLLDPQSTSTFPSTSTPPGRNASVNMSNRRSCIGRSK